MYEAAEIRRINNRGNNSFTTWFRTLSNNPKNHQKASRAGYIVRLYIQPCLLFVPPSKRGIPPCYTYNIKTNGQPNTGRKGEVMKKLKKAIFLALFLSLSTMFSRASPARADVPDLTANSYIKMYTLSTENNTCVYTDSSLSTQGTSSPYRAYNSCIYANDELYVYSMGQYSSYVSYPTSSGRRYGYVKTSALTTNNAAQGAKTSTGTVATYRRTGASRYGYVEKGDKVYTLASSNGYRQVIYPVGRNWKCGWVSDSEYGRYIGGGRSPSGGSGMAVRESSGKIAEYALTQLGTGDSGGDNDVIYNTWYYGRRIHGSGYAWCQAFVSYCADQVGVLGRAVPKTARCQTAVEWYQERNLFHKSRYYGGSYTPKAGDLVFYTSNGRTSNHVGIATGAPNSAGYLDVVEGNVLCKGGDYKVVRFTKNDKRRVNSSYVLGYASPAY